MIGLGQPRLISLVPSWTETLIEAGATLVGRTRFCVHPADRVRAIPVVGGTKDLDLEKIKALKPDMILLDREENTREMAELLTAIAPLHVSHVEKVEDMPRELTRLAQNVFAHDPVTRQNFESYQARYETILAKPTVLHNGLIPGFIRWRKPASQNSTHLVYCIWKNPWMAVGEGTFIASMLVQAGLTMSPLADGLMARSLWPVGQGKYHEFRPQDLPETSLILLSSEPYPFLKRETPELGDRPQALVDGESFSWFGLRSLRFLEKIKSPNSSSTV